MPDPDQRQYLAAGLGGLAVALALAGLYSFLTPRVPVTPAPTATAFEVPPFDLERLQGGRVRLSDLGGKVVVIDFWATWCPPCRAEMPWLVAMATRLESKGVVFIAISEDDPPGQVPLVTEFAREVKGLERFAVLGDPDIEAQYGVTSLPTLFIVDRQGRLVKRLVGAADEGAVVALVEQLAAR